MNKTELLYRYNMRQRIFRGENFEGEDLSDCFLQDIDLSYCCLDNCKLNNTNLMFSTLVGNSFNSVEATGANFTECDLDDSTFQGAELRLAKFTNANVNRVSFEKANLSETTFVNVKAKRANFRGANMTLACVEGTNFALADLRGTNLTNVRLLEALNIGSARLKCIVMNQPVPSIIAIEGQIQVDQEVHPSQWWLENYLLWSKLKRLGETETKTFLKMINMCINFFHNDYTVNAAEEENKKGEL